MAWFNIAVFIVVGVICFGAGFVVGMLYCDHVRWNHTSELIEKKKDEWT